MSGNGNGGDHEVDLRMIYGLLQSMSARLVAVETRLVGVEGKLDRKADRDDVVSLRQTVAGYHATVVGHGILYSEIEDRLRRVERRLEMGAPT